MSERGSTPGGASFRILVGLGVLSPAHLNIGRGLDPTESCRSPQARDPDVSLRQRSPNTPFPTTLLRIRDLNGCSEAEMQNRLKNGLFRA